MGSHVCPLKLAAPANKKRKGRPGQVPSMAGATECQSIKQLHQVYRTLLIGESCIAGQPVQIRTDDLQPVCFGVKFCGKSGHGGNLKLPGHSAYGRHRLLQTTATTGQATPIHMCAGNTAYLHVSCFGSCHLVRYTTMPWNWLHWSCPVHPSASSRLGRLYHPKLPSLYAGFSHPLLPPDQLSMKGRYQRLPLPSALTSRTAKPTE